VIVGHVKDGMELAREFGLPRRLHHFIEAHHGTTLVEYFYQRARKTAAEEPSRARPTRWRRSSTATRARSRRPKRRDPDARRRGGERDADDDRAHAEPDREPGAAIARKRLLDGQFDECDLTLTELAAIEDAMIARLCAVHHSRISYPSSKTDAADAPPAEAARQA
jgi:hypothetical protein